MSNVWVFGAPGAPAFDFEILVLIFRSLTMSWVLYKAMSRENTSPDRSERLSRHRAPVGDLQTGGASVAGDCETFSGDAASECNCSILRPRKPLGLDANHGSI